MRRGASPRPACAAGGALRRRGVEGDDVGFFEAGAFAEGGWRWAHGLASMLGVCYARMGGRWGVRFKGFRDSLAAELGDLKVERRSERIMAERERGREVKQRRSIVQRTGGC